MDESDLVILTPLWRRPHRVAPIYDSVRRITPGAHLCLIVSADDAPVLDAVHELFDEMNRTGYDSVLVADWPGGTPGDYARKMNMGFNATAEPHLFLGADDLLYHPGWLKACGDAIERTPGPVGVVGTNDLGNRRVLRGEHSTHSLVMRDYVQRHGTIDEPNKMLHEGYVHEYVDDELVETAKSRRAYAHADDAHVEHLHPLFGKAAYDESYEAMQMRMTRSRTYFMERRKLWR